MSIQHRRVQPRAPHHAFWKDARQRIREGHCDADVGREDERHADVVDRSGDAVDAGPHVRVGLQHAAADERLVRTVVVGEIEVSVERNRVGDRKIVRLIARPGVSPMGNQSPEHEDDEGLERAPQHPGKCIGVRGHSTGTVKGDIQP